MQTILETGDLFRGDDSNAMSTASAYTALRADLLEVLNGVPHAVAILDKDLRIVGMNWILEALTGYEIEKVRWVYNDFVIHSNLGSKGRALFNRVIEEGEPAAIEGDVINSDRKKVPIRFTVSPLRNHEGMQSGLMVVLEDISLKNEFEKKCQGRDDIKGIIGHSPKLNKLFELLPVLAHSDASVLITGETGTGKDLLAEAIHKASKRATHPFIKVNCGAIPEALLESELFGHVRGAFTGAHSDKPGMFRLAQGGTLFLTEIGDLPLPLQVKLLTVLDDMEFFPLGSSRKVTVDVRLITGTHRDLRQLVREGKFREDLFFRLNVLHAHMPPLRERGDDVLLLIDHFVRIFSGRLGKSINSFTKETVEILMHYHYPGNVRELRNIVEYAANICQGDKITPEDLPANFPSYEDPSCSISPTNTKQTNSPSHGNTLHSEKDDLFIEASWSEIEKKKILRALTDTAGNRGNAAKKLGWSRSTLWRKINQYEL